MTSLTDFDQGGTFRPFYRQYLGPSIGWVQFPSSVLPIATAGTFQLQVGVTLVTINVAGSVTIKLPVIIQTATASVLPGLFGDEPITIVDVGGNAQANPITIQPGNVSQSIMGIAQIQITVNYGSYTLLPIYPTWVSGAP